MPQHLNGAQNRFQRDPCKLNRRGYHHGIVTSWKR
jgi:hypothetical protein